MRIALVLLVGCGGTGSVFVYDAPASGNASATISPDRYELSVLAAGGDVDGDGQPDFFIKSDEITGLYFGVHDDPDASIDAHADLTPLGDLDGDGLVDFAVGDYNGYQPEETLYRGGPHPFDHSGSLLGVIVSTSSVDTDGDGTRDLVVVKSRLADDACDIDIYRGGQGFDPTTPTSTVLAPICGSDLAVQSAGDINGGGHGDIVVTDGRAASPSLSVYLDGAFLPATADVTLPGGFPVAARDFDGDGYGDLAVSDHGNVVVYFGPDLTRTVNIAGQLAESGEIDGHPALVTTPDDGGLYVYFDGHDVADIVLSRTDNQYLTSAAIVGNRLLAGYAGWRAE